MRATFLKSPSETSTILPSLRFVLGDFDERIWRVLVWPLLILPVPVFLKRFFAPVWVFNLGIFFSILARAESHSPPVWTLRQGFPRLERPYVVYLSSLKAFTSQQVYEFTST